jgi:hypothetical protein
MISKGVCITQPSFDTAVFARIKSGLFVSQRVKREFKQLLASIRELRFDTVFV